MVVVTKSNFIEQSNDLLNHLPSAAFVAIDEEMTGISVTNRRVPKDETPSQRYPDLKKAPETYSIIQLGVSLFHYCSSSSGDRAAASAAAAAAASPSSSNNDNVWTVRRYNFFVFPSKDSERSVVLNPAAVAFLHQHNISFDKWTKEGVPFQTEAKADEMLKEHLKKELEKMAEQQKPPEQPTVQEASRRRVQLRRTEDIDFFSRTMAGLRGWLDSPVPPSAPAEGASEGAYFLLPECNSFMRRALYEAIEQEYPSLIVDKVPGSHRMRVWRLSDEEKEQRAQRLRKESWQHLLVEKVGLFRVFHALSQVARGYELERDTPLLAANVDDIDWEKEQSLYRGARNRRMPIVVHNGFMDLCFLLSHFVSHRLPDELTDCKRMIRKYFPVVFDTKILALEYSSMHQNENTRLGNLFQRVNGQVQGEVRVLQPRAKEENSESKEQDSNGENADAVTSASVVSEEHYADYDAYMTGVCFLGMSQSILRLSDDFDVVGGETAMVGNLKHLLLPHDHPLLRKLFGRNLLYQFSMFTMDLEDGKRDPLCRGMEKDSTIRVANIQPSVTTRDIMTCVSGLSDQDNRPVNFEIIWIDDTTFMVTSVYRPPRSGAANGANGLRESEKKEVILLEHGRLLHSALVRKFEGCSIMTLGEHIEQQELENESESSGISAANSQNAPPSLGKRILGWFGRLSGKQEELPSQKKRKLEHVSSSA